MGNNNTKSVFKEYIHLLDLKVIQKMIDHENLDKYVKALCAYKVFHLCPVNGFIKPWAY